MSHTLRRLAIYVDELADGSFHWFLVELGNSTSGWIEIAVAEERFSSWVDAWDAGCVAMHKLVFDERTGPRVAPGSATN